jgi:predicted GNAT superfamily acetyltransferase
MYSSRSKIMRQKSGNPRIGIRKLDQYSDFEKLVDIQRAVWKHDETDITPTHQFRISSKMGGILLGAHVGKELAGFVFSFPAVFEKKLCQHSHHLAVLPAYQGLGIGKRLKWAQRDWSLRLGYDLITWTQDPLQARNANLNFRTLGAMSRTYFSNFYGTTPSLTPAPDLPTDRLLLEWPIRSPKVEMRRRGKDDEYNIAKLAIALEKTPGGGDLPASPRLSLKERFILAEVPARIRALEKSPALISSWQGALRKVLSHYFRRGYAVVDLLSGERCFYILEKRARA